MGLLSIISHRSFYLVLRLLQGVLFASSIAMRCQTLATTVPLLLPTNIAVDAQGNLYVSETAHHMVRKVDTYGELSTVAGSGTQGFGGDGGAAASALLDSPLGLAVSVGKLYIADSHNHRVRSVDLVSGIITTVAGNPLAGSTGDGGKAVDATLDLPASLAADPQGNLYIADLRAHRIRRIAANGIISTIAGTGVQGFEGDGLATASLFDSPGGLAVDATGDLYVSDTHNNRVRRINVSTGTVTTIAGTGNIGFLGDTSSAVSANLALPRGISLDQQGNVYVADSGNHRIRLIDAVTGVISSAAGDGTQGFFGDGGSPLSAGLDSPGAVTISSAGTVNIADTGNSRVRRVAAGGQLQTIAGAGALSPTNLMISGPSTVIYGTGQLVAMLSRPVANGTVSFLDIYAGSSSTLASLALNSNSTVLDLSALPVGQHTITATYSGDQTQASAQSESFGLAIVPATVTATVLPTSIMYGQPVPSLTGSVNGVLARDQSSVSANFSTTAAALSPVGSYPVTVTLTGPAAGNYVFSRTPVLAVTPANTVVTLSVTATSLMNGNTVGQGQAVLMAVHVASLTSGIPTGSVTIFDGGVLLGSAMSNAAGDVAITTSSFAAGEHRLTATYGGDGNYRSSTSAPALITVSTPSGAGNDFSLYVTGNTTQKIISGGTASFTLSVQPQSNLASQITLTASGLPNLAEASFNPPYIAPGSSATTVTFTIATPLSALRKKNEGNLAFAYLILPFVTSLNIRKRKERLASLLPVLVASLLPMLFGCGDRIYTSTDNIQATKAYSITVTGTGTGAAGEAIQHTARVTLVVMPTN